MKIRSKNLSASPYYSKCGTILSKKFTCTALNRFDRGHWMIPLIFEMLYVTSSVVEKTHPSNLSPIKAAKIYITR